MIKQKIIEGLNYGKQKNLQPKTNNKGKIYGVHGLLPRHLR